MTLIPTGAGVKSGTAAGGDLSGTYPSPSVASVGTAVLGSGAASATTTLLGNRSWAAMPTTGLAGLPNDNKKKLNGAGGWSSDPLQILASGRGYLIETHDIALNDNATAISSGNLFAAAIGVPAGTLLTGAATFVTIGSAALTHGWYLLFDSTLALVRQTADTTAAFNVTNAFVSINWQTTLTPAVDTLYYLAFLPIGASITTPAKSVTTAQILGQFGGNAWRSFTQTGLAAIPTPPVPAATALTHWMALT